MKLFHDTNAKSLIGQGRAVSFTTYDFAYTNKYESYYAITIFIQKMNVYYPLQPSSTVISLYML